MKWIVSSHDSPVFGQTVLSEEGATTAVDAHRPFVASNANDGVNAGADRISEATAAIKKPVLKVRVCQQAIRHGVCAAKLPCYRTSYKGRVPCKRLQVEGSYASADLLLQVESKMRYYPACIPEDCIFPRWFVEHRDGRIQCSVRDGQMQRCDCAASMDALLSLRRMAA